MIAYNRKEMEQLFMAASYSEEIVRRKLASQLVLTLGKECGKEKLVRILSGYYRDVTVSPEQLKYGNVECNTFYVMEGVDKILVAVSDKIGDRAEIYADYGSADGTLAIGKEAYRTVDDIIYELDVADAKKVRIIVYMNPLEYEVEELTEIDTFTKLQKMR